MMDCATKEKVRLLVQDRTSEYIGTYLDEAIRNYIDELTDEESEWARDHITWEIIICGKYEE